jgi:hypothetical protein
VTTLRDHLERGYGRPVRYRLGEGVNVWGSRTAELAQKLDKLPMSEEVAQTLRDLFEEIGQQARDAQELRTP